MTQAHSSTANLETKTILILGASYAGLSSAHYLLKHCLPSLPSPSSYNITLVSPSTQVICRPACPRALISESLFQQDKLFVSIPPLIEHYNATNKNTVTFVHGVATDLDHAKRTVTVRLSSSTGESKEIPFYALVIATGASTTSPLMGLNTADSSDLKAHWESFRTNLSSAKRIVIAGGGPAGIETAGELGEYLNGRGQSKATSTPKVEVTVVTSSDRILPLLRPSIVAHAETLLADVGVKILKNAKVVKVTPEGAGTKDLGVPTSVQLEDGSVLEADLYIPAIGMIYNSSFISKELLTSEGRVKTNSSTLRVDAAGPRIYSLGDVSSAARPAVHLTFEEVPVACGNLKRDLLLDAGIEENAVPKEKLFVEDVKEMHMVPIGKSKGVGAVKGWWVPSWFVWAIKGRDYWLWTTGRLWSGQHWNKET